MEKTLYAFTLGREYKLSLAELGHVFGFENLRDFSETIAIFELTESLTPDVINHLGGTIRIIQIIGETDEKKFATDVITHLKERQKEGKINFALGSYGTEFRLSDIGLRVKKTLQDSGLSARLVNTKNENINAATFKKERLGKSQSEYSLIKIPVIAKCEGNEQSLSRACRGKAIQDSNNKSPQGLDRHAPLAMTETRYLIGTTLACQDIDAYARRDTGKSRDMVVGMMPPKLVQMMINISTGDDGKVKSSWRKTENTEILENLKTGKLENSTIYDPFCGLGTTLIEAANMGYTSVYGSDLSPEMVTASEKSLQNFIAEEKVWQERIITAGGKPKKDFSHFESDVFQLDARDIEKGISRILKKSHQKTSQPTNQPTLQLSIVSEGYLGEVMSPRDISLDRVKSERRKLASMYEDFFRGLASLSFRPKGGTNEAEKPAQGQGRSSAHTQDDSIPSVQQSNAPTFQIVMSFPFWNIHGTYSYFTEIYDIIEKHGLQVEPLIPSEMKLNTMKGSLLYRRENQTVGREIVKIVKK